jgi:hypothetical protein
MHAPSAERWISACLDHLSGRALRRTNIDRLIRLQLGDDRNGPHRLRGTVTGGTRNGADPLEHLVGHEPRPSISLATSLIRRSLDGDDPSFALSHNYPPRIAVGKMTLLGGTASTDRDSDIGVCCILG